MHTLTGTILQNTISLEIRDEKGDVVWSDKNLAVALTAQVIFAAAGCIPVPFTVDRSGETVTLHFPGGDFGYTSYIASHVKRAAYQRKMLDGETTTGKLPADMARLLDASGTDLKALWRYIEAAGPGAFAITRPSFEDGPDPVKGLPVGHPAGLQAAPIPGFEVKTVTPVEPSEEIPQSAKPSPAPIEPSDVKKPIDMRNFIPQETDIGHLSLRKTFLPKFQKVFSEVCIREGFMGMVVQRFVFTQVAKHMKDHPYDPEHPQRNTIAKAFKTVLPRVRLTLKQEGWEPGKPAEKG